MIDPTDWYSQALKQGRMDRLVARGFNCRSDEGLDADLRYAEFEFQVYSKSAQWLARRNGDDWTRAPDQKACNYLRGITAGRQAAEPWNATWEQCLRRWEGYADPEHDQVATEEPYACPVIIDCVDCDDDYPSEKTVAGDLVAANVWTITTADAGRYYFARDFSGMFEISQTDPAYQTTQQWEVPPEIFNNDWLYANRHSFMQAQEFEHEVGVRVQPWRVCEMLPALLGTDKQHVQQDDQWRRLFRQIRCMTDVESDGFFDRVQGYDKGNLSIPLYHYTLDRQAANKGANCELGAVLAWLKRVDPTLAECIAALGLANVEKEWVDDNGWGKAYDAGSGSRMAAGPAGAKVVSTAKVGAAGNIEWLRRPHFHYRVAMLLRTVSSVRVALWKLAVHRLRNIAWAERTLPNGLAERRFLGKVLTSEQALAIVLRLHIWLPSTLNNKVLPAITTAWKQATDATPDGDPMQRQTIFEQAFCDYFVENEPDGSNLSKVWHWPAKINAFHPRLRQAHLEGDDDPPKAAAKPPPLSREPYSSPFWKKNPDPHGAPIFADPVDLVDRDSDFKGAGHPAAISRYTKVESSDDFGTFGTAVGLPAKLGGPAADSATFEQRVRESLGVLGAPWVLVGGALRQNPNVEPLRPHSDGDQYRARRQLYEMRRDRVASALRFTTSASAPAPADSLWALDAAPGKTVRVFDWRDGVQGAGVAFASTDAAGGVTNLDRSETCALATPANFDISDTDLAHRTFDAFALALGSGAGVTHVDQFRAEPTANGWQLVLGGVRQSFSSSGKRAARASEWGFLVEFLAWRYGHKDNDDGWTGGPFGELRMLGFDAWVPQASADNHSFLHQRWPAVALGSGKGAQGGLDGMKLVAVPRLWNAPRPNTVPTEAQLAAAMLTWPSIYRLRTMFQTSKEARRGLYDVWRIGMRAVLSLKPRILKQVFGAGATMYRLFQMPQTIGALAYWRYVDPENLQRHFEASKEFASLAKEWRDRDAAHVDYAKWTWEHEREFFWDVVVKTMKNVALRDALARLRPEPVSQRMYQDQLANVLDLDDLDEAPPPLADNDYQAMLLKQGGPAVSLGLLAQELPAVATFSGQGSDYLVGGLVPMLRTADGLKAVPLMLPEPVRVRLTGPSGPDTTVTLYTDRDSAGVERGFASLNLLEPFAIEADVSGWLGELAEGLTLTLVAEAVAGNGGASELRLSLRLAGPWLHKPIVWSHEIGNIKDIELSAGRLVWRTDFAELADASGLPLQLEVAGKVELAIGLAAGVPDAVLRIAAGSVKVNLGSPIASLVLEAGNGLGFEADLLAGTASVFGAQGASVGISLELAALVQDGMARIVPTDVLDGVRVPPFNILFNPLGGSVPSAAEMVAAAGTGTIDLSVPSAPRIAASLFRPGPASWVSNPKCALLDIAPEWLAGLGEARYAWLTGASTPQVNIAQAASAAELTLPVRIAIGQMSATATLKAGCAVDSNGYLSLTGNCFACALSELHLEFDVQETSVHLGGVLELTLPPRLEANLRLDGASPASCLSFEIKPGEHPTISIPREQGFVFDVSDLALGSAGLTLAAQVRKGPAQVEVPVLDQSLTVRDADGDIGRLRIERGRLVAASLAAQVRLRVFDDAEGVLTLRMTQNEAGLTAVAELDVGVDRVFHLRALYLQVLVNSINLSLTYTSADQRWVPRGGLTGSLKFEPAGPMVGKLGEYANLFDGTSVHFENLDLAKLGVGRIKVLVTPRTFEVGKIFAVTWRGFVLEKPGEPNAFFGLRLLGDITFKQQLPNLRTALTLGDIRIWQARADSLIPQIKISSLGIEVALNGGFSFKGYIEEFDDEQEYGFGGSVELSSEALPATQALLKLTRLKNEPGMPAIVVYVAQDREDSLGYGFFLRRAGIGAAVNQGLRGFSDGEPANLGIAGRVERALQHPQGLPYPGELNSWIPHVAGQPRYLLAAYALISFGLLPMDKDHPMVGSAVLAIDDNLDIVMGVNGWFATAPANAMTDAYLAHPAIKGALGLSPRQQVLYGRFMTLPNAQFGESANADPVMIWLKLALDAMRLSAAIYADPRGALLEVGYPRQARFQLNIGPLSGLAEGGFRFGYYRGTHVIGVNLSVTAELAGSYSGDLGIANIELSARARFQLQGAFAGALTMAGRCYVRAELIFSAYVEVSARAYKRIHISGWFFSFDLTVFDVSLSIGLTATAMLEAAIVPSGPGFNGTVDVHLQIAGFSIGARVRIGWAEARVDEARRVIDELVPPIPELIGASSHAIAAQPGVAVAPVPLAVPVPSAVPALADDDPPPREAALASPIEDDPPPREANLDGVLAPASVLPADWRWYVVVAGDQLRIVLFPDGDAGSAYPPQHIASGAHLYPPREHRLVLNEAGLKAYQGVVGSAQGPSPQTLAQAGDRVLVLTELADDTLLSQDWLRRRKPDAPREMRVGDLLADLQPHVKSEGKEVVDPRTIHPVPGDFDDPAVLADPSRLSTRFRKRSGADGSLSYDDHLRNAMMAAQAASQAGAADPGAKTTSSGELLMQLLNMACDPLAEPGKEIASPAPTEDYDRHLLASRIGLVIAFTRSQALETALNKDGLAAILDLGQAPRMFGIEVANWRAPLERKVRFQIVPGYAFQGKGEIGLVWDLLRTDEHGTVTREGPGNHSGIMSFRVQRRGVQGVAVPPSAPVHTLAHWLKYEYERDSKVYFVRPQFQYLDSGLPLAGSAVLEYQVEAIADDGKGDTVVARQVIRVHYQVPSNLFSLTQAKVLLRLPAANAAPGQPLMVELVLDIDAAVSGAGGSPSQAQLQQLKGRIEVYRRAVQAGTVGRYGQGQEADVTVSWSGNTGHDGLRLPNVDQARQLTSDDFDPKADLIKGLVWSDPEPAGADGKHAYTYRASLPIPATNADAAWDALLGVGQLAAELHVRLGKDLHSDGGLDLPTAMLRCRIAVTRAPEAPAVRADGPARQDQPVAEGTEVAALERVPVAAVRPREREWLGARASEFRAELADAPFNGRRDGNDIGIRLRGIVNHAGGTGHPYGAVVGYRIWARDTLDAHTGTDENCIGDFLVYPEPLFRALPQSVVVRPLAGAAVGAYNWEFEDASKVPATAPEVADVQRGFARFELACGKQAMVHASIVALDEALNRDGHRARIQADEPMWPVSPETDLLDKVLERNPEQVDSFGWRLLEAIGGCVTCWVERDDDRVGVDTWAGWLPERLPVRLVSFSRLKPGERIDGERLALYGVRVFAQPLLDELFAAHDTPGKLDDLLKSQDSQLALALGIVAPGGKDGPPTIWLRYAQALVERVHEWRTRSVVEKEYPTHLHMWEQTVTAKDAAARAATALPEVRGQVHYFQTLDAGYARLLGLAVEVVRRYDLLPATSTRLPKDAHVVKVPRTQPLQPEHWSVAPDPEIGAIRALVAVHPAQRAALYQDELTARVQFVDQRVQLYREVLDGAGEQWQRLFAALAAGLDLPAFEGSWALPAAPAPRPVAEWALDDDRRVRPVANAYDEFHYPCVPPGYRYGVRVRTQAGVRHSAETPATGEAPLAEPMFTDGQGLAYQVPALAWVLDDGVLLHLEFALVRGVDALPEWVREHWTRRDLNWTVALGSGASDWQVPILQLPDLRAAYSLVVTAAPGMEPALRVELLQFEHAGSGAGEPLAARLLVDADPNSVLKSTGLVQLQEGALAGRLGISAVLDLSAPELGWLRSGLAEEPPRWRLTIEVQRDGIRYGTQGGHS